jgi:hypothetical protein
MKFTRLNEKVYADSGLGKWFGAGGKGGTTKGGWDRYNTKGEKIGKCGDKTSSEGKPKCLSANKAAKMSKKDIANAVRRKRKSDPSTDRPGTGNKPINVSNRIGEESNPRIPRKKGQPAGSKKHSDLYTDENPEGTIHGLGFKDVATAKSSVSKIKKSDRSHAHKIQAAVAMEQRAKEMGKSSEASVYRKFIDSMKKKTKAKNEEVISECWSTHVQQGFKMKGGKRVPNCVPRNEGKLMRSFKEFNLHEKSAAWQRKEGKNKEGGLNAAGRKSYERENPGSDLKAPVSAAQAKKSKGGKAAKRRKSFCARMGGMPGPMKDENGKPTRKALALRKWDC